jgi:hypothetical protein
MKRRWQSDRTWSLTTHDVQIIRKLAALGYFQSDIAAFFGVTQQMVSAIVLGKKRAGVPDNPLVDIAEFIQRERGPGAEQILALAGVKPTKETDVQGQEFRRRF